MDEHKLNETGGRSRPEAGHQTLSSRITFGIVARGPIAVGVVAIGGVSVGLISIGAVSIGVLAIGGVSLGALAIGGIAVGYQALGGLALGFYSAAGGLACAAVVVVGVLARRSALTRGSER